MPPSSLGGAGYSMFPRKALDYLGVEESLAFAGSLNLQTVKITIGVRIYPQTGLAGTAIEEGLIAPENRAGPQQT